VHAPDQPVNFEYVPGVAFSVTFVPGANQVLHVALQLTPLGVEVTRPGPMPPNFTVSCIPGMNFAVTDRSALIVSAHDAVPVQAPDQPVNTEPNAAFAVSVTGVLSL
jgi:hypothetical protein